MEKVELDEDVELLAGVLSESARNYSPHEMYLEQGRSSKHALVVPWFPCLTSAVRCLLELNPLVEKRGIHLE